MSVLILHKTERLVGADNEGENIRKFADYMKMGGRVNKNASYNSFNIKNNRYTSARCVGSDLTAFDCYPICTYKISGKIGAWRGTVPNEGKSSLAAASAAYQYNAS